MRCWHEAPVPGRVVCKTGRTHGSLTLCAKTVQACLKYLNAMGTAKVLSFSKQSFVSRIPLIVQARAVSISLCWQYWVRPKPWKRRFLHGHGNVLRRGKPWWKQKALFYEREKGGRLTGGVKVQYRGGPSCFVVLEVSSSITDVQRVRTTGHSKAKSKSGRAEWGK